MTAFFGVFVLAATFDPELAAPELAAPELVAPELAAPELAATFDPGLDPELAATFVPELAAPELAALAIVEFLTVSDTPVPDISNANNLTKLTYLAAIGNR